jgi:diguanylate cyclase (GGDEF)-like protein
MFQNENSIFRDGGLDGSLEETPLPEVFGAIWRRKASGVLKAEKRDESRTFSFEEGALRLAVSSRPEQRLGAFLRNRGQISEDALADAVAAAAARPTSYFGEILLERGCIADDVLAGEIRRLVERIVHFTFPWNRGTFRFEPGADPVDPRLALQIDTPALIFEGIVRLPENERFKERLGDPASVPYRRARIETPFRAASPAGLFLARIDGKTPVGALIATGPGNPAHAARLLYAFRCSGWVRWPEDASTAPFDRNRLEETYRRIDWISHYELLGVPRDAGEDAIRRAAEETLEALDGSAEAGDSTLAHKRDTVRARVLAAEEVLRERGRRAAYDRELDAGPALVSPNDGGDAELRRESAMSSYRRARELIHDRDYYPAVKMLEQAAQWAPEVAEYRFLLGQTQRRNPMWKERAIENLREAARLDPSRSDVSAALADALLDRRIVEEASPLVDRAESLPGGVDRHAELRARLEKARAAAPPPEPPPADPRPRFWDRIWNRTDTVRELEERAQVLEEESRKLAAANENLKQLSLVDGLTGVGNRRRFDSALAQEWALAIKQRRPISLVMIDVDHFKAFNDACGHQSGDECLQLVARCLSEVIQREEDVLARYGGEEFAAILRTSGPAEAATAAEAFRERIERLRLPHPAAASGSYLTVSVGVATAVPRAGASPSTLLAAADEALYRSKHLGRNRVTAIDRV